MYCSLLRTKKALNMSAVFKVPAPVSEKVRRVRRPLSPQPSTSSAPCPPLAALAGDPIEPDAGPAEHLLDSVYCHVDENIRLNDIGQLRGLKSGRRRGRWRKLQQAKLALKYTEAIKILEPMLKEEIVKQQSQHVLITSALDHFANTVNGIVDKFEGKKDPTDFTERLEAFKKKAAEFREKRRAKNPNAAEFLRGPPPPPPKLSEEEANRRLCEETEAAIEALLTGDKKKETLPDHFAHFLEVFKMA